MEVWITRQEEKHRRYLPGILLESILIFLVNGVGTFALLHTLVPSVNGIPFLVSVAVTVLLCGFLFRLREHFWAAVFSLSAASGICLAVFSGALLNGFLSLWNQLANVLGKKAGIYGMVGGQVVDVENNGKFVDEQMLHYVYKNKTCKQMNEINNH